jgi:aspartate/methionine/tyrosine aminotransferase
MMNFLKNYCHITGGLAKDFGLSGFRIGICYTYNEEIRAAFSRIFGYLLQSSTHTQYLLSKIFADE